CVIQSMRRRILVTAVIVVVLGGLAGASTTLVLEEYVTGDDLRGESVEEPESVPRSDDMIRNFTGLSYRNATVYEIIYDRYMDSVVSIKVLTETGGISRGTGFVYDSQGHVVTNYHVIANEVRVQVMFRRGEWREATVVGTDAYSDLAVLSVEDVPNYVEDLDVAESDPEPGERVAALGNPFGLQETITHGIVSGVNRTMETTGGYLIPDVVQTDAPMNPGNSGGPLVDVNGTVVGVNRAKKGDNVGFAISPDIVNQVVPSLIKTGDYDHPYLGVGLTTVTPVVADIMGLNRADGVLVTDVVPGGPAYGILQGASYTAVTSVREYPVGGDIILSVGGRRVDTVQELTS
ncbi:MAG: trypsin-like peptidase domain-containing protein, partial [Halobacteria archaeon]|nr:trypsin-like peptidase domain-containing protein [Halobacteria archaeon]